jgi:nucleotide-binding universal stress UspA family protein
MQDPYSVLGVRRDAPDTEVRSAYRRQVKLHHPDHNNGSPESARRFEEVQEAYATIQRLRGSTRGGARTSSGSRGPAASSTRAGGRARADTPPPPPRDNTDIADRLAALEHQVQQARRARDRAQEATREAARAAREAAESVRAAAASASQERPSDEELGYIKTDDTIGKILSDARSTLSEQYGKVRQHPVARRVSDLIDGLEELTEKLDRPAKRVLGSVPNTVSHRANCNVLIVATGGEE